jgi:MYXO-CTERM domain-containing protein
VSVLIDMAVVATVTVDAMGNWSTTVPTALGDGMHRIDVIATDLVGNVADSTAPTMGAMPVTFSVNTRANIDITGPVGTSGNEMPTVTGTADPGASVVVTLTGPGGATQMGTVTADAMGNWSFPTTSTLVDGDWTTTAVATNLLGVMATDMQPFVIDTMTVVDFLQPGDAGPTGDATPELSGTGEPGATVVVMVDGASVGTVTVDAEGNWTLQLTTALTDATHNVSVTATDAQGNTATDMGSFVVDTTRPAVEIGGPADNAHTNLTTPTITGVSDPGQAVVVVVDGMTLGTVIAGVDGYWSIPVTTTLAAGPHTVRATATDAAGNMAVDEHNFIVDVDAPSVNITGPADGASTGDTTPTITGTSEPGATVEVYVGGVLIDTVTVGPAGTWTATVTTPLLAGPQSVRAVATDAAGNTATDNSTFIVDLSTFVTILQPGDSGPIGDTTPELSGQGEPGATVEVTIDGMVLGTATVDAEGNWTFQVPAALADGPHNVSVLATDVFGNTATDTGMFVIDTDAPALEIRNPGDNTTTTDTTPTITGSSEPGTTVSVYVDGVFLGTAITNIDGTWSVPVTMALVEGVHTVFATTTDAAGNNAVDTHDFTVDLTAPGVGLTGPTGRIADPTPTLTGTSEPNARVEVLVDGVLVGTVTAGTDGNWSVDASTLTDGEHTVRAVARDEAGNTATDSGAFVIDTATTVTIVRPSAGGTVGSALPTYTGTAEPGATVTISVDGMALGMVVAGADGRWSFTQPTALTEGMHTITARAVDTVGNAADTDADFTYDRTMLDSDGDGIPDSVECTTPGSCPDTDMDGTPDQLDPDDDGDGVPTAIECATGMMCPDTDMDGRPDYLDPDDDGDGRPTRDERPGMISVDTDGDGRPDYLDTDDDGDGLLTSAECMAAPCRDTDMDMRPDYLDADDDNDGILTARERTDGMRIGMGGDDVDTDGIPNWLDTNSDGDMINDREEGLRDSDMDGRPDYLDPNQPDPLADAGVPGADTGPRADTGAGDAGMTGGADAGAPITGGLAGGACGCSAAGTNAGTTRAAWLAVALGLVLAARRKRR